MSGDEETPVPVLSDPEQREELARLAMMQQVVELVADSEDTAGRGIGWDEILLRSGIGSGSLRRCVKDLEALRYLVKNIESIAEEGSGDVSISTLHDVYGTTFFGRKWLSEQ